MSAILTLNRSIFTLSTRRRTPLDGILDGTSMNWKELLSEVHLLKLAAWMYGTRRRVQVTELQWAKGMWVEGAPLYELLVVARWYEVCVTNDQRVENLLDIARTYAYDDHPSHSRMFNAPLRTVTFREARKASRGISGRGYRSSARRPSTAQVTTEVAVRQARRTQRLVTAAA